MIDRIPNTKFVQKIENLFKTFFVILLKSEEEAL